MIRDGKLEKSFVGDPVSWPGLVYSPLNTQGLLFAVGAMADKIGLIFEEFHNSGNSAVCRRKTENGWERIKVGLAVRSSEFSGDSGDLDLIICWIDDADGNSIPKLELIVYSTVKEDVQNNSPVLPAPKNPGDIRDDFLAGNEARASFEETIRQLDSRIKKLKSM